MQDKKNSLTQVWKSSEVALLIVDYQEEMFDQLHSSDPAHIEFNMKFLINIATALKIPIVLSTVGVEMGVNGPTRKSLMQQLQGVREIDRSSMNAWEDKNFRDAVLATGKKRLIFTGLYTEICLTFPVISALAEGFDVTFPSDAVAGLSTVAHKTAIERMIQAGAVPNTTLALATELFRDWKSPEASIARPYVMSYMLELNSLGILQRPKDMGTEETIFYS